MDGTLVLLQTDSLVQTLLPKFGLADSDSFSFQYDRNWWGVSTSADFRIETVNLDPENVNTISSDAYLDAWIVAADPLRHEAAIQGNHNSLLNCGKELLLHLRWFHFSHGEKRFNGSKRDTLGSIVWIWTLVGEIETSHVPTFQTVLLVDRRLRIEEISVKKMMRKG